MNTQRRVLLIGRSQAVLDGAVASLRDLGYDADGTNDFGDIATRFDAGAIDLVVFGGAVPPELNAELRVRMGAINPGLIFVDGLAGIPGLIVNQVQGAFAADHQGDTAVPAFKQDDRTIRVTLADPAHVEVTAWWRSAFASPNAGSESLVLLHDSLAGGDHAIPVPAGVPLEDAFATVRVDSAVFAFSLAAEQ